MDNRSPCLVLACEFKDEEKNNKRCFNCKARIEYVEKQRRTMEKPGFESEDLYSSGDGQIFYIR